jgi:hypothetical protein
VRSGGNERRTVTPSFGVLTIDKYPPCRSARDFVNNNLKVSDRAPSGINNDNGEAIGEIRSDFDHSTGLIELGCTQ